MIFPGNADKSATPLDNLEIAAPCHVSWDGMTGDERVRHCQSCKCNVYNISEMSKKEAEEFIAQSEGRLCVRFYKRKDGTILTDNCPVGLRTLKRFVYAKTAGLAALFSGILLTGCDSGYQGKVMSVQSTKEKNKQADVYCTETNGVAVIHNMKGKVVYTTRDIPNGKAISAQSLEEKELIQTKIPQDALASSSSAIGRISKFPISAGQIICWHDLLPANASQENDIFLSEAAQEKLAKKAAQKHKTTSELIKSWILERLKN